MGVAFELLKNSGKRYTKIVIGNANSQYIYFILLLSSRAKVQQY